MSAATVPFQLRNGFFPFCIEDVDTVPTLGSYYDFVPLVDVDGDAGFAQAMRLYWLLERVSFTPTGTASYFGDYRSFSRVFSAPGPDLAGLFNYEVGGAVVGNVESSSPGTSAAEPARRACPGVHYGRIYGGEASYPFTPSGLERADSVDLFIRCIDGEWRLYYRFFFGIGIISPVTGLIVFAGIISNPSSPTVGVDQIVSTGSLSLFGLSLDYVAHIPFPDDCTFTGAGLSAVAEFWDPPVWP